MRRGGGGGRKNGKEVYGGKGQKEAEKPLPSSKEEREAFVPLMTHAGAGVMAPAVRPNSFEEAGRLALGYLKNAK